MYEFFSYVSENFESIATIIGSVVVGSSALCALIPGAGWLKKLLAILALNVRNATPEDIAKTKKAVDLAKELTKPEEKK